MDFTVPADHRVKLKESEKKDKYLNFVREVKKNAEHESNSYRCSWYNHQKFGQRTGGLQNKKTSEEDSNYKIAAIGQNTEKSPGDLRRLVVTHSPVKNQRLKLM